MIEIKEEDIERSYDADKFYLQITKIFDSEQEADRFEQQILQDHEDAKKLRNENQSLKYERVDLIIELKKYRNWLKNNKTIGEKLQQGIKDRQIVKRLEEDLENVKSLVDPMSPATLTWKTVEEILQKILEGKK